MSNLSLPFNSKPIEKIIIEDESDDSNDLCNNYSHSSNKSTNNNQKIIKFQILKIKYFK